MTVVYGLCFLFSILTILYLAKRDYSNIDIYYWTIVVITPFIILGYWIESAATDRSSAMIGICLEYIDSSVLIILMLFSMFRSMSVKVNRFLKAGAYGLGIAHLGLVWFCRNNDLYYASFKVVEGVGPVVTDGPLKIIHYIYLVVLSLVMISAIAGGFIKRGTYSRRTLTIYAAFTACSIVCYAVQMIGGMPHSFLPLLYVIADVVIALNYDHAHSHDINALVSECRRTKGSRGFVAFDLHKRLLGSNEQAKDFIPELGQLIIDEKIKSDKAELVNLFYGMIEKFENGKNPTRKLELENCTCECEVSYFSQSKSGKTLGYLFELRDITEQQNYLRLVEEYNQRLNEEVERKTQNIINIQQKVVLGLANMIENRDQNTGGHVKRTSDTISILVKELRRKNPDLISEKTARDIVRSAPMHDLGKISIDNQILCKPAKLSDEEYAVMKTHSPKSGEIVLSILQDVEEQHFVDTAFNLSRYHHERWDGKGYPEGLAGESIPLAARIMAVADVYDALVSKRCYKEPMSFEDAFDIMIDCMGSQFDPMLKDVFINCRSELEEYYNKQR